MLHTVALVVGAAGTAATSGATTGATTGSGGSPALSADPAVDLVDGQDITVHGTGLVPGSRAVVYQCENGPVGPVDCELATNDSITPYDSVQPLCDWARQVHAPCDLVTYAGHGHGTPSTADLVERSARFLAEHVLEPRGYLDAGHRCTAVGTPGDDRLVGTRRDDVLCGRGGHDWLIGRGGNDRLFGGTGDDRLRGGSGDDQLLGGPDRDRADGGRGRDTCDVEHPKSCSS